MRKILLFVAPFFFAIYGNTFAAGQQQLCPKSIYCKSAGECIFPAGWEPLEVNVTKAGTYPFESASAVYKPRPSFDVMAQCVYYKPNDREHGIVLRQTTGSLYADPKPGTAWQIYPFPTGKKSGTCLSRFREACPLTT